MLQTRRSYEAAQKVMSAMSSFCRAANGGELKLAGKCRYIEGRGEVDPIDYNSRSE